MLLVGTCLIDQSYVQVLFVREFFLIIITIIIAIITIIIMLFFLIMMIMMLTEKYYRKNEIMKIMNAKSKNVNQAIHGISNLLAFCC